MMMLVRVTTVVVVVLVLVSSLTQAQRAQRENNKACKKDEECVKKTDCGKNINIIRFCDDNNNNMVCCPSNNRKRTSADFDKDNNKSVKSNGKDRLKALEKEERKERRKEAKENRDERYEKMRKEKRRKNRDEDDKEMRKGKERRQKTKKNRNESDKKIGKRKERRKEAKENRNEGDKKIGKGKRRKVKMGRGKGKEEEIRNEKNKERRNKKYGKTRKGAAKNNKRGKGMKKRRKGNEKMITERKQQKNAKDRKKEIRTRKRGKKKTKATMGKKTIRKGGGEEEGEEENPEQIDLEDNDDAKSVISQHICGGKCGKKKTRGICTPENKCKGGTFVLNPECASVKVHGDQPCGCCIIHKPVICKTRGKCRKKGGKCKEICDDDQVTGSKCGKGCVCCHDAKKCELTTKCKKKKGKCVSKDECNTEKKKFKTKLCKDSSNSGDCGCCFKKKKKKKSCKANCLCEWYEGVCKDWCSPWERPIENGCIVKGKKPCKCCAPECVISPECKKWGGFCVSDTDDILWKCMAPNNIGFAREVHENLKELFFWQLRLKNEATSHQFNTSLKRSLLYKEPLSAKRLLHFEAAAMVESLPRTQLVYADKLQQPQPAAIPSTSGTLKNLPKFNRRQLDLTKSPFVLSPRHDDRAMAPLNTIPGGALMPLPRPPDLHTPTTGVEVRMMERQLETSNKALATPLVASKLSPKPLQ
ncbi:hypothetical protein Pcinc_002432 [Petrolisthes cinctipes]|uniref:Uncharacterized protein n=1 Tax=Petrolisthes cinctipes TaxID=88211 RepID=A0AAE1GJC7_PETCI|nr:hypothetical protein Pcinc_002432 [Petrolisthes cinctipes]